MWVVVFLKKKKKIIYKINFLINESSHLAKSRLLNPNLITLQEKQ